MPADGELSEGDTTIAADKVADKPAELGKIGPEDFPFVIDNKRNKDGNVDAGTHLIIMDNLSCQETISKSNPVILNYYRQFLIKGFD